MIRMVKIFVKNKDAHFLGGIIDNYRMSYAIYFKEENSPPTSKAQLLKWGKAVRCLEDILDQLDYPYKGLDGKKLGGEFDWMKKKEFG